MKKFKSHRYILLLSMLMIGATCSESGITREEPDPDPDPKVQEPLARAIGINVNEQVHVMRFENLERTNTTWFRNFFPILDWYPDESVLENNERIENFLEVKRRGHKTIFNLKWDFANQNFPEVGSEEFRNQRDFLFAILDKVWSSVDIIVVGNEPFIESLENERNDKLVNFYKEMLREVNGYKEEKETNTPIYFGAFNRLDLPGRRYPGVVDMFEYVRAQDWIEGVDIHIHHNNYQQMRDFLDYTEENLREEQRILITEFSLVWYWKDNLTQNIPEAFANEFEYETGLQVHQYLDMALKNQVTREEWVDFLSSTSWFEDRKDYLTQSLSIFKEYENFHVATYALRQAFPENRTFTASDNPWILNGVFSNRTVQEDGQGRHQPTYSFFDNFVRIQEEANQEQ